MYTVGEQLEVELSRVLHVPGYQMVGETAFGKVNRGETAR